MIRRRDIVRDCRGTAAVEFALIAPVFFMLLLGVFDMGYNMYTASLLHGEIQKAARDSTIEGAASSTSGLDNEVTKAVRNLVPGSTINFARKSYADYTDVSRPEDFIDGDSDGVCNNGETFEDANGNGTWDADRGSTGLGGARDAVLYEVTVSYPRLFPIWKLIDQDRNFSMTARTVLRNQPYDLQGDRAATGTC